MDDQEISQRRDLDRAYANFGHREPVDLLIGAPILPDLMISGLIRRPGLIAQLAAVSWTISGQTEQPDAYMKVATCSTLLSDSTHASVATFLGT